LTFHALTGLKSIQPIKPVPVIPKRFVSTSVSFTELLSKKNAVLLLLLEVYEEDQVGKTKSHSPEKWLLKQ